MDVLIVEDISKIATIVLFFNLILFYFCYHENILTDWLTFHNAVGDLTHVWGLC